MDDKTRLAAGIAKELQSLSYDDKRLAEIAAEAVAGGIWQVLHHYIEHKRLHELCDASPQLVYLTLNPFIGPEPAAETARRPAASAS